MPATDHAYKAARRQRKQMSLPEVLLWQRLRRNPCAIGFRRQHPIGAYVLDFYCPAARLAIEIDGIAHDMGNRPERDEARTVWLAEQGLQVVRVAAREVLRDPDEVAEMLVKACQAAQDPSTIPIRFANGEDRNRLGLKLVIGEELGQPPAGSSPSRGDGEVADAAGG